MILSFLHQRSVGCLWDTLLVEKFVIISMVFIFSHPLTLLIYSKPETNLNQMGWHESWTFKINLLHI